MHRFSKGMAVGLLAAILVGGCDKASQQDPSGSSDDSSANFWIKDVTGVVSKGSVDPISGSDVADSVVVDFTACLIDRASQEPLRDQNLLVSIPGTTRGYNLSTDGDGCGKWEEKFPYNYYIAQSGYVVLNRDFIGQGVVTGKRRADLAVDPWTVGEIARDSGRMVVFLNHDSVPADQILGGQPSSGALLNLLSKTLPTADDAFMGVGQEAGQLIIQAVDVKAIPKQEGQGFVSYTYEINMEPVVRTKNANGETSYEPVKDGNFGIWANVLASEIGGPMDRKALILVGQPYSSPTAVNGKLKFEAAVSQDTQANQGNLELAIKIVPHSVGHGVEIQPFNGLISLGSGTQLGDATSGTVENRCLQDPINACDFTKEIQSAYNYQDLVDKGYLSPEQRYIFSNTRVRFFRIRPGETATQRTVEYTASTCITDQVTGKPLINTPVSIHFDSNPAQNTDAEQDLTNATTDITGCLYWPGAVFHKYYQQERYYERTVTIAKESGFSAQVKYILNPWDTNVDFGYDVRELGQDKIDEIRNRPSIPSELYLKEYGYHTQRFLYNIDQFMELEVQKNVLIDISPSVLRYSAIRDARGAVEQLRDGIYLMKVAIQKKYLDPRDNSGLTLKVADTPDSRNERRAELVDKSGTVVSRMSATDVPVGGTTIPGREYITYDMALVRVMDGSIIYPFKFAMKDLRLMRARANFMIELQTADERLVQAYQVFKTAPSSREDLEKKLKDFKDTQLRDGVGLTTDQARMPSGLADVVKSRNNANAMALKMSAAQLQDAIKQTEQSISLAMKKLTASFRNGTALGTYLTSNGDDTNQRAAVLKDGLIDDNFSLSDSMLAELKAKVGTNDFSSVELPLRDEIDLNIFAESDSGLEPRSFVGPVIFLNNAYEDSLRPTDALGNNECAPAQDPLKQSKEALALADSEYTLQNQADHDLSMSRPNNAYVSDPYFGALTDLCGKSVDDLIKRNDDPQNGIVVREREWLQAVALKSTFMRNSGAALDFLSLTDEALQMIDPSCNGHFADCVHTTSTGVVKIADAIAKVNQSAPTSSGSLFSWFSNSKSAAPTTWKVEDSPRLFFDDTPESRSAICNLLALRIGDELTAQKISGRSHDGLVKDCMSSGGLLRDLKYRVEKMGDYTYLGGLNLNFDVGQNFTTSWSHDLSLGASTSDIVGAFAGALEGFMGLLVDVPSFKVDTSMGTQTGSSVSANTYLISQIAKFHMNLAAYERCEILRLSDQAILAASNGGGWVTASHPADKDGLANIYRHGFFVCEGDYRNQHTSPMPIDEMYFYFSQHFTEGDMLDEGDLYNQPWLLGMRGFRDFAVFTNKIEAQETPGFMSFLKSAFNWKPQMQKAWALDKMDRIYKDVGPTYPGYYTVLLPGEDIPGFLLQDGGGFTKTNPDPLSEGVHKDLQTPLPTP